MTPEKRRSFLSLLFVTAVDNFGFSVVFVMFGPLLLSPIYHFLPESMSVATRSIYLGVLFAAYPLTQLFGAPILGDYADKAGRKKALYITIIGVIVGLLFSGVACLLRSINLLIISRLLTGFFAGNLSICLAAIADLSEDHKTRSRNFGIITVAWGVTWPLAMLVGGYLSDPQKSPFFNPALPFWVTAAVTLLSLLAIMKYYHEVHKPEKGIRFDLIKGIHNIQLALKIKQIRPYFLVILLWTLGWGTTVQWFGTFSLLKYGVSQQLVSWALIIQGIFWMLGGSVFNPLLLKRFNTLPIALIAFAITTLLLFASLIPPQYLVFCILYWFAAIFASFAFSNSMNLASIHAPEGFQGKIMGLSQSMMSFGWFVVPLVAGFVTGKNTHFLYLIGAFWFLIATVILFFEQRHESKQAP